MLDLYSDCLLASGGMQVTATGLSTLLEGKVSHDALTRFLAGNGRPVSGGSRSRLLVRRIESEEGMLIVDDTIIENEKMEWKSRVDETGCQRARANQVRYRYVAAVGESELGRWEWRS